MIGSFERCLQLPNAELMILPYNQHVPVHVRAEPLACDSTAFLASREDHELIFSRVVGMTFSGVCGGLWGGGGDFGERLGNA